MKQIMCAILLLTLVCVSSAVAQHYSPPQLEPLVPCSWSCKCYSVAEWVNASGEEVVVHMREHSCLVVVNHERKGEVRKDSICTVADINGKRPAFEYQQCGEGGYTWQLVLGSDMQGKGQQLVRRDCEGELHADCRK